MPEDVSKKREHVEATGTLDLGLSFLLNGDSESSSHSVSPVPQAPSAQETPPEGSAGSEAESPYEKLASTGSWSEILRLAEGDLSSGDDARVRTWWIYAHLQNRSMPASFLAAPLESLLTKNTGEAAPADQALLERTAHLVHRRLVESGDATLAQAIAASISSAKLLPAAVETLRPASTPLNAISSHRVEKQSSAVIWGAESVKQPLRVGLLGVVAASVFCLLAALGIFFAYGGKQLFGAEVAIAAETFVSQDEKPELLIPALDRRDLVGRLGALYYSIDKGEGESGGNAAGADVASVAVSSASERAEVVQPASGSGSDASVGTADSARGGTDIKQPAGTEEAVATTVAPKLPKERVNTTSPVEGPDFRERAGRNQRSGSGGAGAVGTTANRSPAPDDGRSRRLPAETSRPEIVMGMPEPERTQGRYYTVLVSCSVLDAPNYSALVVSQLRRGETVFVEARVGGWLRLRSRNGRAGFVLAQDLVEASRDDFREP
jgi:hypothetical protein